MARLSIALVIVVCSVVVVSQFCLSEDKAVEKIQLSEILRGRVQIVGLLGRPVGEVLRIHGFWRESGVDKGSSKEFVIEKVNEVQLPNPVVFESFFVDSGVKEGNEVQRATGERWEMIAYEGIRISQQEALNKALNRPLNQDPFEGLRSYIAGVVVKVSSGRK